MQVVSQIGHFRLFREGARHIGCREIAKPFRNSGELNRLIGRAKTIIGFGGQSIGRLIAQKLARLIGRREIVKAFRTFVELGRLIGRAKTP